MIALVHASEVEDKTADEAVCDSGRFGSADVAIRDKSTYASLTRMKFVWSSSSLLLGTMSSVRVVTLINSKALFELVSSYRLLSAQVGSTDTK